MSHRLKDARPRVALWMLVALGDIVLLLAAAGLPVLFALLSVVVVALAVVGGRWFARRNSPARPLNVAWPRRPASESVRPG